MIARTIPKYEQHNQAVYRRNALIGVRDMMRHARPKRVRPILDFAEAELRYTSGRYKGQKFDRKYQPATALLLEQLTNPQWLYKFVIGPQQGGKSQSLITYLMWLLFEKQEDVIFALPDIAMRAVKFQKDIRPSIVASRYESLLPKKGAGSQGGVGEVILFDNGVSLEFKGAGGGDSQRAGSTARHLLVTEAEKFGVRAAKSEEGSKWEQIVGRVQHFAGMEDVVAESTITTEDGLMWSEYVSGSQSVVKVQCHACDAYVSPERENLVGWQDAKTEDEARSTGRFSCPSCGILWSEEQRRANLQTAVLVHSGQTIDEDGEVAGDMPPTQKLGFRFSAATNAFADAGSIAVEELGLARSENVQKKDSKDRALNQFRFAVPVKPKVSEVDALDGRRLMTRAADTRRGIAPVGTERIYAGVDVRRRFLHWSVIAFGQEHGPRIIEWGMERMLSEGVLFEDQLMIHGKVLQDRFRNGFQVGDSDQVLPVRFTLCDAGWKTWDVQRLCDLDDFWMPSMGFGAGYLKSKSYRTPKKSTEANRLIGNNWHLATVADRELVELSADSWKSTLHQRLRLDVSNPYAVSFAGGDESGLRELIGHLTSEKEREEYVGGEIITTFSDPVGENHWLDATYYALAAENIDEMIMAEADVEEEEIEWEPQVISGAWD